MATIDKVKARLAKYPNVDYAETLDSIQIHPASDGFTVGLRITARGFAVHFDGWHDEFTSEEEALDCVAFGLSEECRLAVVVRGTRDVKWTVETLENGAWTAYSEVGLLWQPFWRRARIVHRQNHLIRG